MPVRSSLALAPLAFVLLAACGTSPAAPKPAAQTVTGTVVFDGDGWAGPAGGGCSTFGHQEAADVHAGAQVTVKDATGAVVGVGTLGAGAQVAGGGTFHCGFGYTVSDLGRSSFYQFVLANRAPVAYSYAQLSDAGWTVSQTVS